MAATHILQIILWSIPSLAQPSKNPWAKQNQKVLMKIPLVEHDEKGTEKIASDKQAACGWIATHIAKGQ